MKIQITNPQRRLLSFLKRNPGPQSVNRYAVMTVAALNREGLVESLGNGQYQITEKGRIFAYENI